MKLEAQITAMYENKSIVSDDGDTLKQKPHAGRFGTYNEVQNGVLNTESLQVLRNWPSYISTFLEGDPFRRLRWEFRSSMSKFSISKHREVNHRDQSRSTERLMLI